MTGTTNLNLTEPTVGGDLDAWGGELNADLVTLDAMLAGALYGLTLSAAGSTATFGVAAGAASGMSLGSAYTKTAGAWTLGSGNGALDTGSIANSTWYHVFLIQRSDTGVVDVLISTSLASPTMPASYDRKRRIGSMKTDGSAQWVKFTQIGNWFNWAAPPQDIDFAPTTSQVAKVLSVPPGLNVLAKLRGFAEGTAASSVYILVSSPLESTAAASTANSTVNVGSGLVGNDIVFETQVWTDTSKQVNVVASNNGATNLIRASTVAWMDLRGQ